MKHRLAISFFLLGAVVISAQQDSKLSERQAKKLAEGSPTQRELDRLCRFYREALHSQLFRISLGEGVNQAIFAVCCERLLKEGMNEDPDQELCSKLLDQAMHRHKQSLVLRMVAARLIANPKIHKHMYLGLTSALDIFLNLPLRERMHFKRELVVFASAPAGWWRGAGDDQMWAQEVCSKAMLGLEGVDLADKEILALIDNCWSALPVDDICRQIVYGRRRAGQEALQALVDYASPDSKKAKENTKRSRLTKDEVARLRSLSTGSTPDLVPKHRIRLISQYSTQMTEALLDQALLQQKRVSSAVLKSLLQRIMDHENPKGKWRESTIRFEKEKVKSLRKLVAAKAAL